MDEDGYLEDDYPEDDWDEDDRGYDDDDDPCICEVCQVSAEGV